MSSLSHAATFLFIVIIIIFQVGLGVFFEMQGNGYDTKGYFSYLPLLSMIQFYFCTASGEPF